VKTRQAQVRIAPRQEPAVDIREGFGRAGSTESQQHPAMLGAEGYKQRQRGFLEFRLWFRRSATRAC
jgi:hypothetical protein